MITFFGGASLVILALCVGGLVLHHRTMKKRWRVDAALELLDEIETAEMNALADEDQPAPESDKTAQEPCFSAADKTAAIAEYEAALAEYDAYVSHFPGNVIKKVLHLP